MLIKQSYCYTRDLKFIYCKIISTQQEIIVLLNVFVSYKNIPVASTDISRIDTLYQ